MKVKKELEVTLQAGNEKKTKQNKDIQTWPLNLKHLNNVHTTDGNKKITPTFSQEKYIHIILHKYVLE